MKNIIVRAQKKPIEITAFQWNANEPFLREFVQPSDLIHFRENKLEVWNSEEQSWINVPHLHWIIKGIKGEYYPCSPEVFKRSYNIIQSSGDSTLVE